MFGPRRNYDGSRTVFRWRTNSRYSVSHRRLRGWRHSQCRTSSRLFTSSSRTDPQPGEEPVTPPSVDKLEKNSLSEDAAELLRVGRLKEALVETWFMKDRRADLGEQIAEAFRRRYARLRDTGYSPDEIFGHLQQYAGAGGEPRRQTAVLAVLSYFFERCDIFDDPEVSHDPADQAHSN